MRVIRFQFSLMLIGMTGWIFNTSCVRLYGPTPKAVLFWRGTLIIEAAGFCAAFARASVSVFAPGFVSAAAGFACAVGLGLSCANAEMFSKRIRESANSKTRFIISVL